MIWESRIHNPLSVLIGRRPIEGIKRMTETNIGGCLLVQGAHNVHPKGAAETKGPIGKLTCEPPPPK